MVPAPAEAAHCDGFERELSVLGGQVTLYHYVNGLCGGDETQNLPAVATLVLTTESGMLVGVSAGTYQYDFEWEENYEMRQFRGTDAYAGSNVVVPGVGFGAMSVNAWQYEGPDRNRPLPQPDKRETVAQFGIELDLREEGEEEDATNYANLYLRYAQVSLEGEGCTERLSYWLGTGDEEELARADCVAEIPQLVGSGVKAPPWPRD